MPDLRPIVRQLKNENDLLRAALKAQGIQVVDKVPVGGLRSSWAALLGVLLRIYPKSAHKDDLEVASRLPGRENIERDSGIVYVTVHHLRKEFGEDAIETTMGQCYRLSDLMAAMLKGPPKTEDNI